MCRPQIPSRDAWSSACSAIEHVEHIFVTVDTAAPVHVPVRQPAQRSAIATLASAASMCFPHPAHVVFEHPVHFVARHILRELGARVCCSLTYYPGNYQGIVPACQLACMG